MLRVAVRRFRHETIGITVGLAGVGLLALVTGRSMNSNYHSSGLATCLAGGSESQCRELVEQFGDKFNSLQFLIVPLVLLPALLGAFVGAPLVARELEAGTHRFLWTQGVTRQRWFAYTSAVAVAVTLLAGALYALIAGAWLDTTNTVTGERFGRLYDFQGVVPIGASAFAVAAGIACGVIIRRTVPAMVATLGIFIVVRVFTAVVLRPHFMPVKTLDIPLADGDPLGDAGAWVLSERVFDGDGVIRGHGRQLQHQPPRPCRPVSEPQGRRRRPDADARRRQPVPRGARLSHRVQVPPGRPVLDVPADRDRIAARPGGRRDHRPLPSPYVAAQREAVQRPDRSESRITPASRGAVRHILSMMTGTTLTELRSRRDEIIEVARSRGASRIRVFGSVARGDATEASDIDFLVDLEPDRNLLDLGGLLMDLRDLLQRNVDVVTERGLRPRVAHRVLADAVEL